MHNIVRYYLRVTIAVLKCCYKSYLGEDRDFLFVCLIVCFVFALCFYITVHPAAKEVKTGIQSGLEPEGRG